MDKSRTLPSHYTLTHYLLGKDPDVFYHPAKDLLQIVNPKVIKNKKQKFSLSEIFLESIVKKKIYGYLDKNNWYHISNPKDLQKVNEIF